MNEFSERIKFLVEKLAGGKHTSFAKKCGIPPGTFQAYINGESIPTTKHLEKFLLTYRINLNWLLKGEGEPFLEESAKPSACLPVDDYELVPLLESRVTAGPEGEIVYEDVADYYPFKRLWLEKLIGKSPENFKFLFLLQVRGDSMSPTINAGEMILINTLESERLTFIEGNIYAVFLPDGSVAIKRLAFDWQDNRLYLRFLSDNPKYLPFGVAIPQGKTLKNYVLGRVRWAGKEFV